MINNSSYFYYKNSIHGQRKSERKLKTIVIEKYRLALLRHWWLQQIIIVNKYYKYEKRDFDIIEEFNFLY